MWPFVDPVECQIAEQCLAQDQPLEAARILLSAKSRGHKAVRELLLRIGPQLVELARLAFQAGDLIVAADLIECAGQCAELTPDARSFGDRITHDLKEQRQQQDWSQRRLEQADRWARDGRLYSAIGMIEPLENEPQAARRQLDWRADVERLERYSAEFHEHLANRELPAAAAVLRKARELAPDQPLVLCLEQKLQAAQPAVTEVVSLPGESSDKCLDSSSRWLLFGLSNTGEVLLLPQSIITIGTPQDAIVELAIQALLCRRHALVIRERSPGPRGERHRLAPLAGATVLVNGGAIPDGGTIWLAHGDRIQFGPEICRWTYRRAVADSATAVLEQTRPDGAVAVTPSGAAIRRVVLLDDEMRIGRETSGNHVVDPSLPVGRLRLSFNGGHWRAAVEHGVLFVNDGGDSDEPSRSFRIPAELVLFADSPELLGTALQGERIEFKRTLKLMDM